MDSFFQQLNGTSLNATKVHQENVKHLNNSKTMENVHHNATHGGGIYNHGAVTHHLGNKTENSTRGKIAKLPNVKKSDIPHPLAGKQMLLKVSYLSPPSFFLLSKKDTCCYFEHPDPQVYLHHKILNIQDKKNMQSNAYFKKSLFFTVKNAKVLT